MNQETYLTERIDNQINWYGKKSSSYQSRYKILRIIAIGLAALIPFLTGLIESQDDLLKIVAGVCGVLIVIIEGLLSVFNYKDLWTKYRITSEALKREKTMFLTQAGFYQNKKNTFQIFVQRAETIMAEENQNWVEIQKEEEGKEQEDTPV